MANAQNDIKVTLKLDAAEAQRILNDFLSKDGRQITLGLNATSGRAGSTGNGAQQARNSASTASPVEHVSPARQAASTPFTASLPMSGGAASSAAMSGLAGMGAPTLRMRPGSGVPFVGSADFQMPTGRYNPMVGDPTIAYTPDQQKWARTPPDPGGNFLKDFRGIGPFSRLDTGTMMSAGFAGMSAAQTIAHYYGIGTAELITQRPDHLGRARAAGEVLGGGLGLGLGFLLGGPMLGSFGGTIGSTVGGAIFSRFGAASERNALTTMALMGSAGLQAAYMGRSAETTYGLAPITPLLPPGARGGIGGGETVRMPTAVEYAERQRKFVQTLRRGIGLGMGYDTESMSRVPDWLASEDEAAQTYSGIQSSLAEGGWNPYAANAGRLAGFSVRTGGNPSELQRGIAGRDFWNNADNQWNQENMAFRRSGKNDSYRQSWLDDRQSYAMRRVREYEDIIRRSRGSMREVPNSDLDLSQFLTSNLVRRYGHAAPEIEKAIAPILASVPETGNNAADILTKFGAVNASRYYEAFAEPGQRPALSLQTLQGVSSTTRMIDRDISKAQYRIRGSGMEIARLASQKMNVISELPDGRDSLAYAEANATRRAGQFAGYAESDTELYSIPRARLQGRRDRANLLPFSPGNSYAIELESMGLDASHLRTLRSRYSTLKRKGELTADQELGMVNEIEGVQTNIARSIATISEGFENRLPALSAGRNRAVGRYTSLDGAQMTLAGLGHPSRAYGARDGGHLRNQDDFLALYGSIGQSVGNVHSTTEGFNNASLDRLNETIARWIRTMERIESQGGSQRASDTIGTASAGISRADLGTRTAYGQKR